MVQISFISESTGGGPRTRSKQPIRSQSSRFFDTHIALHMGRNYNSMTICRMSQRLKQPDIDMVLLLPTGLRPLLLFRGLHGHLYANRAEIAIELLWKLYFLPSTPSGNRLLPNRLQLCVSALLNIQSACPSIRPSPFFVVSCRKSSFLVMKCLCWRLAFSRETWCNSPPRNGHVSILWTLYLLFDSEYL